MKSMTYAQKADLVAKCKRVFESMARANHLKSGNAYRVLAAKALFDVPSLANEMHNCWFQCSDAIKNKPRYRYDSKAGEWVECKARNQYNASLNDYETRERVSRMEEWTRLEMERARQGNSLANLYAERQRIGMAGGACWPASQVGSGVYPLAGQ